MTLSLWPKHLHHLAIKEIGHLTMHCRRRKPLSSSSASSSHHRHPLIDIIMFTIITIANLITIIIVTCSTVGGGSHQMWEGGQRCRQAQSCRSEESAFEEVNRKGWNRSFNEAQWQTSSNQRQLMLLSNPIWRSSIWWGEPKSMEQIVNINIDNIDNQVPTRGSLYCI